MSKPEFEVSLRSREEIIKDLIENADRNGHGDRTRRRIKDTMRRVAEADKIAQDDIAKNPVPERLPNAARNDGTLIYDPVIISPMGKYKL